MTNQVCVISIYVPNLDKAIDFYTNALGFERNKQYGPGIVSLVHGEIPIILEEKEDAAFAQEHKTTGVVLGLKTEDIYERLQYLKNNGVHLITEEPAECPPGKYISFRDPFGNIMEYLQYE